jgi:AcrR family transcriptional regulator
MMARPKQVTDEELLKIALECFLEHGPNVSTQVIADKAGLSQPAVFKRFGTKEELFLQALAPPEHLPVFDWINASPTPGPFRPQLVQLLEKVNETLNWVLPRVQLLRAAHIPQGTVLARYKASPPVMLMKSITDFFERAQQQGQFHHDVNPQFAAQWVFGVLMGRSFLTKTIPLKTDDKGNAAFIEATVDLMCRGILKNKTEE